MADNELPETIRALAACLGCDPSELEVSAHDETLLEYGREEYRVLTESEREKAADESLESYIDDCLLEGVDGPLAQYFDRSAWKRDALLSDGYGHTLSSYDGEEQEQQIDGTWYFIYRVN
jgi:hypothetical protein